jgi:hypothetical protein
MKALPTFIAAEEARFPLNYELAKNALAVCERLDECKEWASKTAAIVSYAKQSKDKTLMHSAQRIQLRAKRRIGELLLAMSPASRPKMESERGKASRAVGLSEGERSTAIAIARAPVDEFESLVDSPNGPASQTDIAVRGRTRLNSVPGMENLQRGAAYRLLMGATSGGTTAIGPFSRWIEKNDPRMLARGLKPDEVKQIRLLVLKAMEWLDEFDQALLASQ